MIARALRRCDAAPGSLIADEVLLYSVTGLEPPGQCGRLMSGHGRCSHAFLCRKLFYSGVELQCCDVDITVSYVQKLSHKILGSKVSVQDGTTVCGCDAPHVYVSSLCAELS